MPPTTDLEKSFKCEQCDRAYTAQANLCNHYRSAHPGMKPPSFSRKAVSQREAVAFGQEVREAKQALVLNEKVNATTIAIQLANGEISAKHAMELLNKKPTLTAVDKPTVKPTLDVGQLMDDLTGLSEAEIKDRNAIIYDHLYYHLEQKKVYDMVLNCILDEQYNHAFVQAFNNQIYCDGDTITYLDGDELREMEQDQLNVCKLFKILCDTIIYQLVNEQQDIVDHMITMRSNERDLPVSMEKRLEEIHLQIYTLSSCSSIKGNGLVIIDPPSDLSARPVTPSLGISYKSIKPCLQNLSKQLKI